MFTPGGLMFFHIILFQNGTNQNIIVKGRFRHASLIFARAPSRPLPSLFLCFEYFFPVFYTPRHFPDRQDPPRPPSPPSDGNFMLQIKLDSLIDRLRSAFSRKPFFQFCNSSLSWTPRDWKVLLCRILEPFLEFFGNLEKFQRQDTLPPSKDVDDDGDDLRVPIPVWTRGRHDLNTTCTTTTTNNGSAAKLGLIHHPPATTDGSRQTENWFRRRRGRICLARDRGKCGDGDDAETKT